MTLLIKNVQIVGGAHDKDATGDTAGRGVLDVFVSNAHISAIGNFPDKKADVVLDGQGAFLAPGFIDASTASDHFLTLFTDRSQEDFLRQGVTTMFGGMCGASLAPLLYGSLESIQKWGNPDGVNVNWHTMGEFLSSLEQHHPALNFGTLVGHSTVRRAIIGEALRDLTKNELGVFARTLEQALAEGAFGLSTGLGYVHARKTPYAELRMLAGIVKKYRGVYATHLRQGTRGIKGSVEETIRLARETGVSTLISHFTPVIGAESEYEEALALINDLPADVDLHFDIYPSTRSLAPIYTFLPEWSQTGGIAVMAENMKDDWLLSRIRKEIPDIDADRFTVVQAPGNEMFVGKSLREIGEIYETDDARDALLRLMQSLGLRGTVLYENLDAGLIARAIASPRSLIASNAPSVAAGARRLEHAEHMKSEHTTETFSAFIRMVEEGKMMPLAEAVDKITAAPAKKFGLAGRGRINEGAYADLVCFRGDEVKFTIVSGKVVEKESVFQGEFAGHPLRRAAGK